MKRGGELHLFITEEKNQSLRIYFALIPLLNEEMWISGERRQAGEEKVVC